MPKTLVNKGDIFEIPLGNNQKAFGQYLTLDNYGPIIRIFNRIESTTNNVNIEEVVNSGEMFPPIYTGLFAAIREKLWKIIGYAQVSNFKFPGFISTIRNPETNEATTWLLWDGKETHIIGKKVPFELQSLEYLAVYSPYDIPKRILTGIKPYDSLIKTNKLPRAN